VIETRNYCYKLLRRSRHSTTRLETCSSGAKEKQMRNKYGEFPQQKIVWYRSAFGGGFYTWEPRVDFEFIEYVACRLRPRPQRHWLKRLVARLLRKK